MDTLLAYAASSNFPVILWADYPNRIIAQIEKQIEEFKIKPTQLKNLQIRSVKELFAKEDDTIPESIKWDVLIDSLQERERYGAGNIGARVDILKTQIAHRIGGIFGDFDTLEIVRKLNFMELIIATFEKLIAQGKMFFRTKTGQPDLIVTCRKTEDSQLFREVVVDLGKIFSASLQEESNITRSRPHPLKDRGWLITK